MNNNRLVPVQYNSNNSSLDRAHIVIVGNGIAGLTAAVEARHLAPDKHIVIITEQLHPTINTPALKQFSVGKLTREQLLAYPAGTERAERIHVVNSRVEQIHAQSKYVTLNGKRGFGYDTLLIATGSAPIGLSESIPGRGFDGVLTLHRLQDYLDLRRRLSEVNEAAVIGGGAHAIETVMGLLHWGIRVHWLIRGKKFMRRILDETASEVVLHNVRRAGAIVHNETEVAGIVGRVGSVAGVITNHQEMIPCQMVLCCTGTQPARDLAIQCSVPMKHKNGILVDDRLRTSVRDIYAAGDVAALLNPQTGIFEPRAQWYAAVSQGRIAGAMMSGHNELARQSFGVQWHATQLGDLSMLTVGDPLSENPRIETLTDDSQGGYRRITLLDERLTGYLSLGATQPDSLAIKRIIDEGYPVRDVIKPLLKGQFDARAYLSRHRTRTAHSMLRRKLPEPGLNTENMTANPFAAGVLPPIEGMAHPGTPLAQQSTHMFNRNISQPLPGQQQACRLPSPPQSGFASDDEINPFTGNLPALPHVPVRERADRRNAAMVPAPVQLALEPSELTDLNPFADKLPSMQTYGYETITSFTRHASMGDEQEQRSGNNPLKKQSDAKQLHYKLWAYLDQPEEQRQAALMHEEE